VVLALGLFTPVVGLLLVLDMGAAMWKYNFNQGIYAVREYKLPLILGLASLVVVTAGGGPFSLDHLVSSRCVDVHLSPVKPPAAEASKDHLPAWL
jgi:uncharacterized membrane protein YphA (DoxX/SURF4 family)